MSTRMKQLDGTSHDVKNHMETNNISNLEIPARVPDWLKEVEKIKEDAERIISSDVNGCFSLKMRYRAGRQAFKTAQQIEALIKENNETIWRDAQKPLGKVSSKLGSTSDGDAQNDFKSREKIFKEALGLLQQDQKAQVIALCGMGGVGKTTMMEQLKKAVEDKKMFDWVVKVVIGQKINILSIQQTMAEYIKLQLTETDMTARADRLRVTFGKMSQESKKVLVVLDDVWENVELKNIGLSPLPNGFKLLLTSRIENVCKQIAVEANSRLKVVRVDVMEEVEANNFFCQISEVSNPELKDIGAKIVRRCGFLPLAIKLIATNLKSQEKSVWRDTLRRLKENDLDENVQRVIEISYTFIAEEDAKAVFLLCGLFPDDFNISIEDLTRYAWGLKLLNDVPTLGDARDRTKTCVRILKDASLLINGDHSECVKMHDLVLAFVVAKVSKGNHPWIVNHGDVSNWSRAEMRESCRRISLTCMGMSEFPRDFNYPNVSLLRLMNGDESLEFPEDFYEKMENLQVMACEKLQYPLLPRSLQCSTKVQTLCLHQCSLMFDCSPIGDYLLNLEVLSFAHSGIQYLPSAIGNLVKLKLLDLTGCIDLRIHEGVLENLVNLEELYMTVANEKGVRFTDINYKELEERSKNLSALEVEFFENNPQSKNMSYDKLERFKISMGRFLKANSGKDMHSSENTLMLVANKDELLKSGINELFSKTEVLHLEAGGMNNLEEVLPKSGPQQLFYNLRVLCVSRCAHLRYLFTVPVASGLVKLERLAILECPVMEALVYCENGEGGVIRFRELKHLYLHDLPMLVGLSNSNDVIDLPQLVTLVLGSLPNFTSIYPEYTASSVMSSSSPAIKPFFNNKGMIPSLEILQINRMESLKSIWPCGISEEVDACLLRVIVVGYCDNLVNMFPSNPMPLLHNLQTIHVDFCGSIEVLFHIDVGCLGEIKEGVGKLRSIVVYSSGKLREVWRLKGIINPDLIIRGFQAVERIEIIGCKRFRNIFTPTTARFALEALTDFDTYGTDYEESGIHYEESEEENNELVGRIHETNFHGFIESNGSMMRMLEEKVEFLEIPLSEIMSATNNFAKECLVGSGGFGMVYKAKLDVLDIQSVSSIKGKSKKELPRKSKTVAIKRLLKNRDKQAEEGFLAEIELLSSCKHQHVVSLLGYSREANEMILVYKYALNGSLSDYLGSELSLTWSQRIQICLQVADGIKYLHTNMEGKPRIIHRDIKREHFVRRESKWRVVPALLGFCYEGDNMLLVYEHASNESLDNYLRDTDNMTKYTWIHRLHHCLGIAHGLNHLHTVMDYKQEMIHVDIRSANILLGKSGEAKIAYFGLSKLLPTNQEASTDTTNNDVCRKVYCYPENRMTRKLKKQSDIYSFGVVLFEIFCGRLAYDRVYTVKNEYGLAPIARQCCSDGTIKEMIDPALKEETLEDVLTSYGEPISDSLGAYLRIANQCLAENQAERPTVQTVIKELEMALNIQKLNMGGG